MCRWTRVTRGTWRSCPLLAMSSSTPSWRRMMKWSSCTWTSPEVSRSCHHQAQVSVSRDPSESPLQCVLSHFCVCFFFTDTGFGTIYVSDDRGTVYSKSLEHHLYTTTGGETDFTNVTSLRGVFVTSILAEGIYCCAWIKERQHAPVLKFLPQKTHM